MLEIEIKARLADAAALPAALAREGFLPQRVLMETDIYYNGVNRNFAKTDEALRLRNTEDLQTSARTAALTYKGPKLDAVSQTRKELEVGVLDGPLMDELLRALGHTPVLTVRKRRAYYQCGAITACVDEVEGLGSFMELEALSPVEAEYTETVEGLFLQLERLGISRDACTRHSYLEMLLALQRKE